MSKKMTDDEARRIITAILEECAPGWRIWGWEPNFILLNKGAEQLMLDRPFMGKR